jgi:hypothetical protein
MSGKSNTVNQTAGKKPSTKKTATKKSSSTTTKKTTSTGEMTTFQKLNQLKHHIRAHTKVEGRDVIGPLAKVASKIFNEADKKLPAAKKLAEQKIKDGSFKKMMTEAKK